ncbi:hypothetical protein PROPHIGD102-1_109 [Mycobacterium phage prophiGD102-1]|nr:hypothetical protein PROPHIGD102-1_109 [Mycobacterium phage prophiGD102-1]
MSIRDLLTERSKPRAAVCTTCQWFATQPEDEQAAAKEWAAAGFSSAELWRGIRELGYPLGEAALRRHFKECS